ncbi:MAG: succinate dehydrogenase hydrophobic membrane anchor subunit [Acidimicrobiales bacterium]
MSAAIDPGASPDETAEIGPENPGPGRRNREAGRWLFMRASGLMLVVLALSHFALTHIVTDVAETDSAFVTDRWDNPVWRVFDWLLLALALSHGFNGVRGVMADQVRNGPFRRAAISAIGALAAGLFVLGTVTIVTF